MVTYTIRPMQWTYKPNSTGIYTIKIAITLKNQDPFYLLTPHRILESQWIDLHVVNHVNAQLMNADIRKRITDAEALMMQLNRDGKAITKKRLEGGDPGQATFVKFAREIRDHGTEIPRFINFAGENCLLRDIDPAFLRKFEKHELSRLTKKGKTGVSENTVSGTMKYVNQILTQALKEKLIPENPFDAYKAPKYIDPEVVWLEEEEKEMLFTWLEKDIHPTLRTTTVYFLLACFSGIRHSDWAKFDPDTRALGGFLKLRATKNNADIVMPIGPTLRKIIDMTREVGRPFSLEICNVHLKVIGPAAGIKKLLTTHKGRHSFGYLCASLGLPKSTTAELMGVSEQTVETYYHLTGQNIIKQAAELAGV